VREACGGLLGGDGLERDRSAVGELMNVAFGRHEVTAEFADEMMAFLVRHAERASRDLSRPALAKAL